MGKLELKGNSANAMSFKEKRRMGIMFVALLVLGYFALQPLLKSDKGEVRTERPVPAAETVEPDETDSPEGIVKGGVETIVAEESPQREPEPGKYTPGAQLPSETGWKLNPGDGSAGQETINTAVSLAADLFDEELQHAAEIPFQEADALVVGTVYRIQAQVEEMGFGEIKLSQEVSRKLPLASYMYQGILKKGDIRIKVNGIDICEEYILGREVELVGIYVGTQDITWEEDFKEVSGPAPLFVFKDLERVKTNPLAGLESITAGIRLGDPAIWDMADDQLRDVIEKEPYYHAIELLTALTDQELYACIDPELEYADLIRYTHRAQANRGKVYLLEGQLLRIEEKRVDPRRQISSELPNAPFIFVGQILEEKTKKPFTFRALDIPPTLKVGDLVEVAGIYVKVFTFPNRMGDNYYTKTPLIMGRFVKRYERVGNIMWIVSAVALLVFIMTVWASLSERKRHQHFERRMNDLKRKQIKRVRKAGDCKPSGTNASEKTNHTDDDRFSWIGWWEPPKN